MVAPQVTLGLDGLDLPPDALVVVLENVVVNEPIDAARFRFTVPDGVDVVGKPVTVNLTGD